MSRLRAGVIGLGVGSQHIAGYAGHGACEVVALCDSDPEKCAEAKQRFPGVGIYDSAEALLDAPGIDVVSVASYDQDHHAQIVRAIANGKHVFTEKPLCLTAEEMAEIRGALAEHPEIRLSANLILRQTPRFRALRERVRNAEMGALFYAEADYNYGRLHKLTEGWRGNIPGYSVTLGGGIHVVDLILWLTGDRVVEVSAFGNGISSRDTTFEGDDLVVAILRFESGMVGKVTANFGCVYPHFHKLALFGTLASFENESAAGRFYTSRDPSRAPELMDDPYPGTRKGDLIPSFIDSILGDGDAIVGVDDVFRVMSVCFAIDKANRERRPVTVEAA